MAKALLGHVTAVDHRMVAEMRRLKQRVDDLEAYISRLEDENATLAAHAKYDSLDSELRSELASREPALT
jgi:cell division protein FtsB